MKSKPNREKENRRVAAKTTSAEASSVGILERSETLYRAAVVAVVALSKHFETLDDKPRMYEVNKALQHLWGIE
jgi:hypothetical protein